MTGWMLAAALAALPMHAQTGAPPQPVTPQPVHWSAGSVTAEGTPGLYRIQLAATVDPGWHLYALRQPDVDALATELALHGGDRAELLRVDEKRPTLTQDGGVRTAWFTGTASFTLRLRVPQPTTLHVLARYQACNSRMCLPVKEVVVPVQITAR